MPYRQGPAPESRLDAALFEHLRSIAEAITIDSAADEIVSAVDLACVDSYVSRDLADDRAFLPNLKHILRDKAHAARRILSRPWSADAELARIISTFVRGPSSLGRLIQSSQDVRLMYSKQSAKCTVNKSRLLSAI